MKESGFAKELAAYALLQAKPTLRGASPSQSPAPL
jgi:hypothetical protein